jgi:type II secretory pathway component GspD/PulD (secretin)
MNRTSIAFRFLIAFVAVSLLVGRQVHAQTAGPRQSAATNVIPLIVMSDVPLRDAIRNLARQTGLNFILDPHLFAGSTGSDGHVVPDSPVNFRWTDITAREALNRVLSEHQLKIVESPATTVARIVAAGQAVEPVTAAQVGSDTNRPNAVIPLVMMDDVPLRDAIRNLTRQLGLNSTLDPALSSPANERLLSQQVSLRWERITPRQALAALLDNYGLVMREDPTESSARIILKQAVKTP